MQVIIFARTNQLVQDYFFLLYEKMKNNGMSHIKMTAFYGGGKNKKEKKDKEEGLSAEDRVTIVKEFRAGAYNIMIASD